MDIIFIYYLLATEVISGESKESNKMYITLVKKIEIIISNIKRVNNINIVK
jgi:hypothetical protein